jgi:hypothetical protein
MADARPEIPRRGGSAVCSPAVTHTELRTLVAAYAAGTLEGPAAETVRVHLASGCTVCLGDLYARPVGLPRAAVRRRLPAVVLGLVGAVALGAAVAWMVVDLRRRAATARNEAAALAARITAVERERAALAARLAAQEEAVATARAALAEREAALAAGAQERAALAARLAAAEAKVAALARSVRRRDRAMQRLLAARVAADDVRALAASPGLRLLALAAVPPYREPYGHVLWRPGGGTVACFVFALPPLPPGSTYELRMVADGRPLPPQRLVPDPDGGAGLVAHVGDAVERRLDVTIVREPAGDALLAGHVDPGG